MHILQKNILDFSKETVPIQEWMPIVIRNPFQELGPGVIIHSSEKQKLTLKCKTKPNFWILYFLINLCSRYIIIWTIKMSKKPVASPHSPKRQKFKDQLHGLFLFIISSVTIMKKEMLSACKISLESWTFSSTLTL